MRLSDNRLPIRTPKNYSCSTNFFANGFQLHDPPRADALERVKSSFSQVSQATTSLLVLTTPFLPLLLHQEHRGPPDVPHHRPRRPLPLPVHLHPGLHRVGL